MANLQLPVRVAGVKKPAQLLWHYVMVVVAEVVTGGWVIPQLHHFQIWEGLNICWLEICDVSSA